jgi:hypothetical protein
LLRGQRANDIYPLQAIGHHTLARVHSTHDNNDWLGEAFPQRIFINPLDAAERGIRDGDLVRVWNERGELVIPARVTPRILPGVVDIPQGAWWAPNENGVDFGGCINVLTSEKWTPFAFGTAQHTIMVQIQKFRTDDQRPRKSHVRKNLCCLVLRPLSSVEPYDLRFHFRRIRLHGLQSLPDRLQGQEQPAHRRFVAAGVRGFGRGVATNRRCAGKIRFLPTTCRLPAITAFTPSARGLSHGCVCPARGWGRLH